MTWRVISIVLLVAGLAVAAIGVLAVVEPETPTSTVRDAVSVVDGDAALAAPDDTTRSIRPESAAPSNEPVRAPIAYEAPETALFGRSFDVTLSLDATGAASAAGALPGVQAIVEGEAQIARQIRAQLSGGAFDIRALSPETQAVSSVTANTWRWSATPTQAGDHELALDIFAMTEDGATPVRTFRGPIAVEVSRVGQAISLAQAANPLFVVLGGLGSALAGLLGAVRLFRGA